MITKTFLATVALATVIALPALAQTQAQKRQAQRQIQSPALSYRQTDGVTHSSNPAYDVYVDGFYVGSDPDPYIRHQLRQEKLFEHSN